MKDVTSRIILQSLNQRYYIFNYKGLGGTGSGVADINQIEQGEGQARSARADQTRLQIHLLLENYGYKIAIIKP